MSEFIAKHLLVEGVIDIPDRCTAIMTNVIDHLWSEQEAGWQKASSVCVGGTRYRLLGWSYATNNFHNCLTGQPTNYATIGLAIEGHFQSGHFTIGEEITLCD